MSAERPLAEIIERLDHDLPVGMADAARVLDRPEKWLREYAAKHGIGHMQGRRVMFLRSDLRKISQIRIPERSQPAPTLSHDLGAGVPSLPTWAKRLLLSARKRAALKGWPCTLTEGEMAALVRRADGRCMVTGISFDHKASLSHYHRPFAPSLDRLKNTDGYTLENVRLVCVAVNIAMKQWGEDVLIKIARGILRDRQPS